MSEPDVIKPERYNYLRYLRKRRKPFNKANRNRLQQPFFVFLSMFCISWLEVVVVLLYLCKLP
ncbi:hypothetical protein HanRHA438_Chr03g0105611 [Helianthus annuus]|nr:hypothetical protein HanRHA438_Chr03g0105611 [Helianthus annuus]